jgi:hypothetical protein
MNVKSGYYPGFGFDVNQPLSGAQAEAFKAAGMDFCIRYLPRTPALIKGNLTALEVDVILTAGLNLGCVQHVPLPGWIPSAALGAQYGQYAAVYALSIGIPFGALLWADLEEIAAGTTTEEVIAYCTAWFNSVQSAGYVPGLYCGWNIVLTAKQLYENLPFKHYWKAYNYDNGVATRGFQLIQEPQKTLNGITYDPNWSQADLLGDTALWVTRG